MVKNNKHNVKRNLKWIESENDRQFLQRSLDGGGGGGGIGKRTYITDDQRTRDIVFPDMAMIEGENWNFTKTNSDNLNG